MVDCRDEKKDYSTAILQRKKSPNRLLVDEVSKLGFCVLGTVAKNVTDDLRCLEIH